MAPLPPPACKALPDILVRAEAVSGERAFEIGPYANQAANGGAPATGSREAAQLDAEFDDSQARNGRALPEYETAKEHVLSRRVAFEWRAVLGEGVVNSAGQADGWTSSGTQSLLGVDIGYVVKGAVTRVAGTDRAGRLCAAGIDAGRGAVNVASAATFGCDMALMLDFSEPVEAVQFRINHRGTRDSLLKARAFDADGHPLPVEFDMGASVTGGDGAATSVLVTIPGPVSNLQVEYVACGPDAACITDIWFDDPATGYADPRDAFMDVFVDTCMIAGRAGAAAIVEATDRAKDPSGVGSPGTPANENTPPSTTKAAKPARDTIR